MTQRYKTVLLFGGPGTGKGTQGKMLGTIHGFHHFSTGDMFRSIDTNSELGKLFLSYSTKGLLVPDEVAVKLWAVHIAARATLSLYKPRHDLLILDGIPRTAAQARVMEPHIDVLRVIHLVAKDREAMVQRLRQRALKEKRPDDANETVIRNRWAVYEEETLPVLECYPKDRTVEVDAAGTMVTVLARVLAVLAPVQADHMAAEH